MAGWMYNGKSGFASGSVTRFISESRVGKEENTTRKAESISGAEIGAGVTSVVYSCERMVPFVLAYARVARRKLFVNCVVQP
jgi:hypothetical protein